MKNFHTPSKPGHTLESLQECLEVGGRIGVCVHGIMAVHVDMLFFLIESCSCLYRVCLVHENFWLWLLLHFRLYLSISVQS
jgi:hypothetical protein